MSATEYFKQVMPSVEAFHRATRAQRVEEDTPIFWSLVRRVQTKSGSHIVPELRDEWSDLDKLRWQAAVLRVDSGVRVRVHPSRVSVNGVDVPGRYSLSYRGGGRGSGDFRWASDLLSGVELGARLARRAL